jgi:hypothetical protein
MDNKVILLESMKMDSQVAGTGTEFKHWSFRGNLVATSSPSGRYASAPLADAFGDLVNGARQTYDWNGLWGYRNELVEMGLRPAASATPQATPTHS